MRKIEKWFKTNWLEVFYFVFAVLALLFLLWYGLAQILPEITVAEAKQAASSASTKTIIENPLGLPHKVLQHISQKLLPGAFGIRLASTIFGFLVVVSFYLITKSLYAGRVALLGTLAFATSAWFLSIARSGVDASMYFLLFVTGACLMWVRKSENSALSITVTSMLLLLLLYIPGLIWIIIPLVFWQSGVFLNKFHRKRIVYLGLLGICMIFALIPLSILLYNEHSLALTYFGLPKEFPGITHIARNFVGILVNLFVRGPDDPTVWLGRVPLLNLFATVMFFVGMYSFMKRKKLDRVAGSIFIIIASLVLVSLGGAVMIAILIPFIFLIVTEGISFLLQQWGTVFPRNPIGRTIGVGLMTIVVLISSAQGISQHFIAWPNTPATRQVHNLKVN